MMGTVQRCDDDADERDGRTEPEKSFEIFSRTGHEFFWMNDDDGCWCFSFLFFFFPSSILSE